MSPTTSSGSGDSIDEPGGDDPEGDLDGDISDEDLDGVGCDDDDNPVLREARARARSDVIELVDDNGIDLLVPALADLLSDQPKHNIFGHISSEDVTPLASTSHTGGNSAKSFDLLQPLEF